MSWETPIHLVRPVRLWSADPIHSRRVSWLELFFDLIFVAAVAQVGVPLGEDYTVHGLVRYGLMDNAVNRELLHELLEALGHTVAEACNGVTSRSGRKQCIY